MPSEIIGFDMPSIKKIETAEQARQLAIDYQTWASEQSLSYGELVFYTNKFEEIASKFNLTDVFKENGII